jgi:hypothetical protein
LSGTIRASVGFGHDASGRAVRAALRRPARDEELLKILRRGGCDIEHARLPGAHRVAATPVENDLALRTLVVALLDRLVVRRRLARRRLRRDELQARCKLRASRHRLRRLGERRVAARVERHIDPAAGRSCLRVAEAVLGAAATAAAAQHRTHHRHRVGAARAAHAHPGHAHAGEGGDVDPGLRNGRLDDLVLC